MKKKILSIESLHILGYYWWKPDLSDDWMIYHFTGRGESGFPLGSCPPNNGIFIGPLVPPKLNKKSKGVQ